MNLYDPLKKIQISRYIYAVFSNILIVLFDTDTVSVTYIINCRQYTTSNMPYNSGWLALALDRFNKKL